MERKVGEIFKYHGEWFQCAKGKICSCVGCAFYSEVNHTPDFSSIFGECKGVSRSDSNYIIFKKLQKDGEPFEYNGAYYQAYKSFTISTTIVDGYNVIGTAHGFAERIEQNNDIDEKTMTLEDLVNDYIDGKLVYSEFKDKVKNLHNKDMETDITNLSNSENIGKNLKPFNLEAAKAGKPVCTRDGRKARIICFDRKGNTPIVALIERVDGIENLQCFYNDGKCFNDSTSDIDLMMLPERKEGWIVIRRSDIYEKEEQAKEALLNSHTAMMVRKITWEE